MMRGIDSRSEIDPTKLLRDTRSILQRLADFCSKPTNVAVFLVMLAGGAYYLSAAASLLFLLGGGAVHLCVYPKAQAAFSPAANHTRSRF